VPRHPARREERLLVPDDRESGASWLDLGGSSPQQTRLAIEQCTRLLAFGLPAPRIREVQRATDLSRATVRHVEESSWIAAMPAIAFGEVEHRATRCALDRVGGVGLS